MKSSLRMLHWLPVLAAALLSNSGAEAAPESWDTTDCVRAGCHIELGELEFDHGVVAKLTCGDCHPAGEEGDPPHPPPSDEGGPPLPATLLSDRNCVRCHAESAIKHDGGRTRTSGDESRGVGCLDCHDPHGGASAAMLRGIGEEVCLTCHADEFEPARARRRRKSDAGEATETEDLEARLHGPPTEEGRCSACHLSHAENRPGLLRGALPTGAYAQYERPSYSSCWEPCHDAALVEEERTTSTTGFRNGDDNLHYRHVAKPKRGRSCGLCHAPHRARGPGLIRNGMPYGKEVLTLRFTPTKSGGTCETSCHLSVEYSRTEAIPSRIRVR